MAFLDQITRLFSGGKLNVKSRFELLREAISGTMSQFYMARDRENDRIVGLKILDREKTEQFMARFVGLKKPSEGEIAVLFDHPLIVKTYEHGLTTSGEQYLVMEFIDGPGMNSVLIARDGALEKHRVHFIRQLAEALAVVHERGYLHRDVCPRNLLLTADKKDLKLTDFGLSVPATKEFMQPGNRTGTPNYMAPELVRRKQTDHRIDVFSFGVTAYEICSFELPWQRGVDGMAAMGHDRPPADIRTYCPNMDDRLARAIHACIEPNADKRCRSMTDFLKMIAKVETRDS